jgi:hypothetical protein
MAIQDMLGRLQAARAAAGRVTAMKPAAPKPAVQPAALPVGMAGAGRVPIGDPVSAQPTIATSVAQPPTTPAITGHTQPVQPQVVPYAQTSTFGPGQDLRATQIAPGDQANRYKIAGDRFDQFAQASEPAYQQAIRKATAAAAANGRLGSGMLTNAYGDVASQRASAMDQARRGFLTDALEGSIQDDRYSRDELRGERGYQNDQARYAGTNALAQRQFEEQMRDAEFRRRMQTAEASERLGYRDNPYAYAIQAAQSRRAGEDNGWMEGLGAAMGYGVQPARAPAPPTAPSYAPRIQYRPGISGIQPMVYP